MLNKNFWKALSASTLVLGTSFVVMKYIAKKQYSKSVYADQPEEQNVMKGKNLLFPKGEKVA